MEVRVLLLQLLGPYKFEMFFTFVFFIVPILLGLMMFSNWFERGVFFLLNYATHRAPTIENISLSDNTNYFKGTAMNHTVHIGDILALLFIVLMIFKSDYRKYFKLIPPGLVAMIIYAFSASISVINAHPETVERSWYAISLQGRQLLFFFALANYFRIPGRKDYQLKSFLFIAVYTFLVSLQQRYLMGLYRLGADFVHPNQMVFYCAPVMILFITLFLNHKENNYGKLIPSIGIFSALVPCLMSLSRGVILNLGLGLLVVFLFDFSFRFKIKKLFTVALLFLGLILGTMKAWDTWYWRFVAGSNPMGTAQRKAYYVIGYEVFKNNMVFGLGINQFGSMAYTSVVLDAVIDSGILASDQLSEGFVKTLRNSREARMMDGFTTARSLNYGGTPESYYVMHFAETGIVGTLGTLLSQGFFIFTCLRSILYFRRRNIFLLNLSVGLMGVQIGMYTQSIFEFILRQENPMYLQAIVYALISSITGVRRSGEFDLKDLDNSPPKEIPLEEMPPPVPGFALRSSSSLSSKNQDAGT